MAEARGFDLDLQAIGARADRSAFERVFAHFAPRLRAYFGKLGADAGVADELVQECLLTIWRKAAVFDASRAAASTWIFTIARNRFIDRVRKERRAEYDSQDPMLVASDAAPVDEAVQSSVAGAKLKQALMKLPQEQAEVLHAVYFAGMSMSDIAAVNDTPLGTVKTRARLALNKLRQLLAEDG